MLLGAEERSILLSSFEVAWQPGLCSLQTRLWRLQLWISPVGRAGLGVAGGHYHLSGTGAWGPAHQFHCSQALVLALEFLFWV